MSKVKEMKKRGSANRMLKINLEQRSRVFLLRHQNLPNKKPDLQQKRKNFKLWPRHNARKKKKLSKS